MFLFISKIYNKRLINNNKNAILYNILFKNNILFNYLTIIKTILNKHYINTKNKNIMIIFNIFQFFLINCRLKKIQLSYKKIIKRNKKLLLSFKLFIVFYYLIRNNIFLFINYKTISVFGLKYLK